MRRSSLRSHSLSHWETLLARTHVALKLSYLHMRASYNTFINTCKAISVSSPRSPPSTQFVSSSKRACEHPAAEGSGLRIYQESHKKPRKSARRIPSRWLASGPRIAPRNRGHGLHAVCEIQTFGCDARWLRMIGSHTRGHDQMG